MSGALALGDAGAFRHPARFAAGQLDDMDADAPALAADGRLAFAADEPGAGVHFRDDEARAEPLRQPTEGASVMPDIGAKMTRLDVTTAPISKRRGRSALGA